MSNIQTASALTLSAGNLTQVPLRDFFQSSAQIIIPVDNSKVFLPDPSWSKTFAAGLQAFEKHTANKRGFAGSHVIEVGVGSGINMAGLMLHPAPPSHFIGTDIAPSAVAASAGLAQAHGMNAALLQSDLLGSVPSRALERTDYIIGCIPQVPRHSGEITDERDLSDYYEETGIPEDAYGLGLIARLLDQAKTRAPQAELVLNIAGRPGEDRLSPMFAQHGYKVSAIHTSVVRQDPGTCLNSLAEIEDKSGLRFHFFRDTQARHEINAHEAEALRTAGQPIYHNLHVLAARLV
jgi:methylase of polypeptide subunit release factors